MTEYTVGRHGCDINADGEGIMAIEVVALLNGRSGLKEALLYYASELHLYAPDHDEEDFRGCLHPDCIQARNHLRFL